MPACCLKILSTSTLLIIIILCLLYPCLLYPETISGKNKISVELQQTNLVDALRFMAKFLDMSIIISPTISGVTTLHLHQALPLQAFDALLMAHGLAKWEIGNVWFIGTRQEFIKQQLDELKWQAVSEESLPLKLYSCQLKFAHAEDVLLLLKDERHSLVSKRGRVHVDARTNTIIIYDIPERIHTIQRFLQKVDVPVKQILIAARLVSVDHDVERELGVHFALTEQTSGSHDVNAAKSLIESVGHYDLVLTKLADSTLLDVKLAALESEGRAELISSPTLFTEDQQTASIEAGDELPYQEVSDGGGTAVSFKKAVLALKVKPHVLPGDQVLLQLQINQDRPGNRVIQGVPSISTRQMTTTVLVKNGQTIVLGGIYEKSELYDQKKLPFVSEIPVLGWLFQKHMTQNTKRELLIFVTPIVIV
jgi:type IV pilus assembly protein PilQ